MADRPVTHIRRHGWKLDYRVSHLAFPGEAWSPRHVRDVVRDIELGRHRYFVPWEGGETEIHLVSGLGGTSYVRTDPDATEMNNLQDLPLADRLDPGERQSVTTWTRLEPRVRASDPGAGLAAPVYDPLWLLARQWQLGEFEPSDGGSPVSVRLRARHTVLDRFGAGPASTRPFDSAAQPLETLVEREPAPPGGPDLRLAAEAGLHFLRALRAARAGHLASRYLGHYGLDPPGEDGGLPDAAGDRFLAVMAGRAPDGRRLRDDLDPAVRPGDGSEPRLPGEPEVPEEDQQAVLDAARRWLAWTDTALPPPPASEESEDSWLPGRMEHAFTVEAPAPHRAARLVLQAREHHGGHLDRTAFDARVVPADEDGTGAVEVDETTLPTSVTFPGMPAPRWWELEDAQVNLGAVDAAREDLAQMVLLEFALVYGNDWFVVPLELPVGSVCRVTSLLVTDSFGRETEVPSVRSHDPGWRLFSLEGIDSDDDVLLLPPTLAASLEGPPLEEVLLARDQAANLGWAVERLVQGQDGRPVDRTEAYRRADRAPAGTGPSEVADLAYRLMDAVPDYWVPLVPTRVDGRAVRLRRGVLLGPDGGAASRPLGRLLRPEEPLSLDEEEVPRVGVRLTRRDEYARWVDGSTHLWRARRKRAGRGEAASGLVFDVLRAPEGDRA